MAKNEDSIRRSMETNRIIARESRKAALQSNAKFVKEKETLIDLAEMQIAAWEKWAKAAPINHPELPSTLIRIQRWRQAIARQNDAVAKLEKLLAAKTRLVRKKK